MASTLNHILNLGGDSLANSRVGVDVTGHNIANAQTPGFSRQRVDIETKHPAEYGRHMMGQGARVASVNRSHDKFIEGQLRKEMQQNSRENGESEGLSRLETIFSPEMTSTVRDRMTNFFNAVREFSNFPEEPAVRINLVESANAFAQSMNETHQGVRHVQNDINSEISNLVSKANQYISEIGQLGQTIKELEISKETKVNDLEDRRDTCIRELSKLIDVQTYRDGDDNITVRGSGGVLLVDRNRPSTIEIKRDARLGSYETIHVKDSFGQFETDITRQMKQGRISGLLTVRDEHAQRVRDQVNTMASSFGGEFNRLHKMGFGLDEYSDKNGRLFFEGVENSEEPAETIRVSTLLQSDPSAVSGAMSAYASGDNVIANKFVKIFYEPIVFDGAQNVSLGQHYDNVVAKLGIDAKHMKEASKASDIVVAQIEAQKESISGVSLDEEAANLLKYQHLFSASSRIITTADDMFRTVLELKRN